MVGPLVGGWLADVSTWRWIFVISVPLVVATLALIADPLPSGHEARERVLVDVVGAALCTLGLAGPVFALIDQPRHGWTDPIILATLLGGLVVFVLFFARERHTPHPMLPLLPLFAHRNLAFANLETAAVYAGLSALSFFLILVAGTENELDTSGFRIAMGITAGLLGAGGAIGLPGIRNT